jgi:HPr kinase/phosphorylase
MSRPLIVSELFENTRTALNLTWISGDLNRALIVAHDNMSPADLIGHLNLIHPERLQVIGAPEMAWVERLSPESLRKHLRDVFNANPPAIIVADGCQPDAIICHECELRDVPLFSTPTAAARVIDHLRSYASRQQAETITLHGVFMDVLGMGVLITGDSGVGKSELGLELISRGHGLVADDVVEVSRVAPEILEGRCPEMLRDFLEVRGLGLLNIRTVFGETACRRKMRLKLIVYLQRPNRGVPEAARLPLDAQNETILGVPIRRVTIPVAAGRNLAVLLEAAVRSTILLVRGIDSMQEFLDRQQAALHLGEGDKS